MQFTLTVQINVPLQSSLVPKPLAASEKNLAGNEAIKLYITHISFSSYKNICKLHSIIATSHTFSSALVYVYPVILLIYI